MAHLERLNILLTHMESGKLGHENFDFSTFNNAKGVCGTNGCMAGELPILFPNYWKFTDIAKGICLIGKIHDDDTDVHLIDFFGLEEDEVNHVFYPEMQEPKLFGGEMLHDESTREEVTANLRKFINLKTK